MQAADEALSSIVRRRLDKALAEHELHGSGSFSGRVRHIMVEHLGETTLTPETVARTLAVSRRRRMVHWNVTTAHPTAEWTVQQLRIGRAGRPDALIRDSRSRHDLLGQVKPRSDGFGAAEDTGSRSGCVPLVPFADASASVAFSAATTVTQHGSIGPVFRHCAPA
jgi:hypothetical protein